MLKLIALATTFLALSAAPSLASFGLMCSGPEGVTVSIPLGAGPGLTPLGAEIRAMDKTWTTEAGVAGTIAIMTAQSAALDSRLYLDFTDPNYEGVLAELRLFRAQDEDEPVYGGTLRLAGHGAWPIACQIG